MITMSKRYRRVYGKTHDTVHVRDDYCNRKVYDEVDELNTLNEIIEAMHYFIKEEDNKLIRIEDDYGIRWLVVTKEDIVGYSGNADIKTYDEWLESITKK